MEKRANIIGRDALISKRMENDIEYFKRVLDAYRACQTLNIHTIADYCEYMESVATFDGISYFEITYFNRMSNDSYARAISKLSESIECDFENDNKKFIKKI